MFHIDELTPENPNKTLYHYTSQVGLLGIVQSKSLWASSISYLNDKEEYNHAISYMKGRLHYKIIELDTKENQNLIKYLECLKDSLDKVIPSSIFVFSFSEADNLLSQWRAYSKDGIGYSIGINFNLIRDKVKEQGFELFRCIYDYSKQLNIIDRIIQVYIEGFNNTPNSYEYTPKDLQDHGIRFAINYSKVAPIFKNYAFNEEKEWRLVSHKTISSFSNIINFRVGKSTLIPFCEININDINKEFIFENIIIGPTPEPSLSLDAVSRLLTVNGMKYKQISISQIPYRNI